MSDDPPAARPVSTLSRGFMLALTVSDLPTSLAFYRDVVGFAVEDVLEHRGTVWEAVLRAGDMRLRLIQERADRVRNRVLGEGVSLTFTVDPPLIRGILERALTFLGAEWEPSSLSSESTECQVRDPDGFKLIISSK